MMTFWLSNILICLTNLEPFHALVIAISIYKFTILSPIETNFCVKNVDACLYINT